MLKAKTKEVEAVLTFAALTENNRCRAMGMPDDPENVGLVFSDGKSITIPFWAFEKLFEPDATTAPTVAIVKNKISEARRIAFQPGGPFGAGIDGMEMSVGDDGKVKMKAIKEKPPEPDFE